MKIKNLTDSAIELGDGRMIGAGAERKYGLKELSQRDQQRLDKGSLAIVEPIPVEAGKNNKKENDK